MTDEKLGGVVRDIDVLGRGLTVARGSTARFLLAGTEFEVSGSVNSGVSGASLDAIVEWDSLRRESASEEELAVFAILAVDAEG